MLNPAALAATATRCASSIGSTRGFSVMSWSAGAPATQSRESPPARARPDRGGGPPAKRALDLGPDLLDLGQPLDGRAPPAPAKAPLLATPPATGKIGLPPVGR